MVQDYKVLDHISRGQNLQKSFLDTPVMEGRSQTSYRITYCVIIYNGMQSLTVNSFAILARITQQLAIRLTVTEPWCNKCHDVVAIENCIIIRLVTYNVLQTGGTRILVLYTYATRKNAKKGFFFFFFFF